MSRIYFHSLGETVEVGGSVRSWIRIAAVDMFLSSVFDYTWDERKKTVIDFIPKSHYIHSNKREHQWMFLRTALISAGHGTDSYFSVNGVNYPFDDVVFNTAYVMSSEVMKFLIRLNAQCEIHAYITGGNRKFVANIIQNGIDSNILYADKRWQDVIKLLIRDNKSEVVTSYSVCEQFPNMRLLGIPDEREHEWINMGILERWNKCFDALRAQENPVYNCNINTISWDTYYWGHGVNGFQLQAIVDESNKENWSHE